MQDATLYPAPEILVSRQHELDQLAGILGQVRAGTGAIVVLSGEAGIGKSALVRQIGTVVRTIAGHCYEHSAAPPYGPWIELLDRLHVEDLASPEAREASRLAIAHHTLDRYEVFTRVLSALESAAGREPLALVLEDMHWADSASVELLRLVARRIHELPVILVITYRSDDLHHKPPLRQLLPDLLRNNNAERLQLQPLTLDGTTAIVGQRYKLPEPASNQLSLYLQARAEGNPFFTLELLYALEEQRLLTCSNGRWQLGNINAAGAYPPIPELVRQVIESRLEQVDSATQHLLQLAAVIGHDVPIDLLHSLAGMDRNAFASGITHAIESHFIVESNEGHSLRFNHALVREVIYLKIVLPERQHLHRLAGEALLAHPAPDVDLVAFHLARAMDARAIDWLALAGEHALSVSAPMVAIEACDRALVVARSLSRTAPSSIHRTRGTAYAIVGEFLRARQDFTHVLDRARQDGDRLTEWQALQDLGQLWSSRDYSRTQELFNEALELARQIQDEQLIAHSLSSVGTWYLNDDQPITAIRFHEEALASFREAGDELAIAQTIDLLGMDYIILGDLVTAERVLRDAISAFELMGEHVALCSAFSSYALTKGTLGFEQELPTQYPAMSAETVLNRAVTLARETHWRAGEAFAYCISGSYHTVRGQFDRALGDINLALSIAREIEHKEWETYSLDLVASTYLQLLALDLAREYAQHAVTTARECNSRIHIRGSASTLAASYLAAGDYERAFELLGLKPEEDPPMDAADQRASCLWFAEALLQSGAPERALHVITRLVESSPHRETGRIAPMCARLIGEAHTALGAFPAAEAAFLAGLASGRELGYQPEIWRCLVSLGKLYQVSHRQGEASKSFSEARTVIAAIARTIPDAELRSRFLMEADTSIPGEKHLTPFQAVKQQSGGLTPRQRDVAVLVAHGKTNASIARDLSISDRTVEGHVSAILTTLNLTSRSQIAAWAVDRRLVSLNDPGGTT